MRPAHREARIITVLALLLAGSVAANFYLYPLARRPAIEPDQKQLVERVRRTAAIAYGADAGRQARTTYPIVFQLADRVCVELRSTRRDRVGNFLACYDPRTQQRLEVHRAAGHF